ncbi:MAG: LD-carboxypeptidase, partial [Chloroflexota bacterium]
MTIPSKLNTGDEIRVVSPSTSLATIAKEVRETALATWGSLGFRVTFGENAEENDLFSSSSIESRVSDLHAAFADPNVKCVLATTGGYNCNQLLRYLDYDLIKS